MVWYCVILVTILQCGLVSYWLSYNGVVWCDIGYHTMVWYGVILVIIFRCGMVWYGVIVVTIV